MVEGKSTVKLEVGGESPRTMRYKLHWANKRFSRQFASSRSAYEVRQIGIWRGCPRRRFVLGAVRFVTAQTRSVSLLQSS